MCKQVVAIAGPTRAIISEQSKLVCVGNKASLTVSPIETGLTYRWYKNGSPIPTTDNNYTSLLSPSLEINVTSSTTGYFSCRLTNSSGCYIDTDSAHLTVSPIVITEQPQSATCCPYEERFFTVTATGGTGTLHYEWLCVEGMSTGHGLYFEGRTTNTLGVFGGDNWTFGYSYYCVITDDNGCSVESTPAYLYKGAACE